MALTEINELRYIENRKDKWYGFRVFTSPNAEVIQHVSALRNQPFPEAVPGICVCNDTRTRYDADKSNGRAKINAFYGPIDAGGGIRPRKRNFAELLTSPSGRMKKLLRDNKDKIIEGFDNEIPRTTNKWAPNFDNTVPDGIERIIVRTSVAKPFSEGNAIMAVGGTINREGGSWDWFGFDAETLFFMGIQSWTDFDDNSLVAIDYHFLYDADGWNNDKKSISSSLCGIIDQSIIADSAAPEGWKTDGPLISSKFWVPGIYRQADNSISTGQAEEELEPFNVNSINFFQGQTWW